MRKVLLLAAAVSLVAFSATGCDGGRDGDAPATLGWGDELAVAAQAVGADNTTTLVFHGDWNVTQGGDALMSGGTLQVDYVASRLPNCRATYNGMNTWSILMYVRVNDDDTIQRVSLSPQGSVLRGTWSIPEWAESLQIWFHNTDRAGCSEYDSANGANYHFEVSSPAVVTDVVFDEEWNETAEGDILQGGMMRIDYAPARLTACRMSYHGGRTWNIFASWRFEPGGQTGSAAMFEGNYFNDEAARVTPYVPVPEDATSVELWFSNSDMSNCSAWDSNFGENYSFEVTSLGGEQVEIGWAGDFDYVHYHRDPATHYGDRDPAYYFDAWGGSELAAWVDVQVWAPGLTDQDYADDGALRAAAEQLTAELVTDAVEGDGPDGWMTKDLDFAGKRGNNFVYRMYFWDLRSPYTVPGVPDGLHNYYFRFSADSGATWYDVGNEDGTFRRFVIAPRQDCDLFPDNPPESCPRAAEVGWAGNWGNYGGHACNFREGLDDPLTYTKSAVGHDCMVVTAEVWVEGVTDRDGDPAAIKAEVETDIGFSGGPSPYLLTHALQFDGRVGNNYRFKWNLGEHVGRSNRDDYRFRFRFSADDGATWTVIGPGDSAAGDDFRTLQVRNDSTDIDETLYCDGLQSWEGATATYGDYCVNYEAESFDATNCEFYVNALGHGHYAHNAAWADWLEAWIRVGDQDGHIENVGIWVRYHDDDDAEGEVFSMGREFEPGYWLTGFTFQLSAAGQGPDAQPLVLTVDEFAFFVDVRRPDRDVERLWLSNGGANYTMDDCYAVQGYSHGIGIGEIEYADESVNLFDQKHACQ